VVALWQQRQTSWRGAVIFGGRRHLPHAEFAIRKLELLYGRLRHRKIGRRGYDDGSHRKEEGIGFLVFWSSTPLSGNVSAARSLGVDYSNDDGFLFDVVQQGPILGLVVRF
jgi:hypothetical protein